MSTKITVYVNQNHLQKRRCVDISATILEMHKVPVLSNMS